MVTIDSLFNKPLYINDEKYEIKQIVIPEIQRDYVQGLIEYSTKFDRFLSTLFDGLTDKQRVSLDFIYGNINNEGIFNPIDGQQRVTTLALLYYYIEIIQHQNYSNNIFKYISYATRKTATDFCKLLEKDEFTKYLSDNLNAEHIDLAIKNYHQYYDIYDYDLTIESMINTLDKIHVKYNEYIKNNTNNETELNFKNIFFKILPMNNFKLSDDLYIKMNGRGKQLANFDNFKADYFKWLDDNSIDNAEEIQIKFNNEYVDFFWDFAVKNSNDEMPDPEKLFFRFINRFVISKYLSQNDNRPDDISDDFINKSEKFNYTYDSFKIYENCFNNEDNHKAFIILLNNLINIKNINDYFKTNWIYDDKKDNEQKEFSIFKELTYKDRFAYNYIMHFFEQEDININEAKKFARIIWNITEQFFTLNNVGRDNYETAVKGMKDLVNIKYWDNIYKSFNELEINNPTTHMQIIIKDEIIKCRYIIKDSKYENIFNKLERLKYVHGMLGFLLNENTLKLDDDIIKIIKQIFDSKDEHKLFIRALLSQIDSIDILESNSYESDNIIKQLISEQEFRSKAKYIIECMCNEEERITSLNNFVNSHYKYIEKDKLQEYKYFTALCTHESLYREEENIEMYKIHLTGDVYWLINKNKYYASAGDMRSYCPVRYKLISGLKILSSTEKYNTKHYTDRNEDIYFLQKEILLRFALNDIHIIINDYHRHHLFCLNKFFSDDSKNIDKHVIGIYNYIIQVIKELDEFKELEEFLDNNRKEFKNIISNIENYTDPFE